MSNDAFVRDKEKAAHGAHHRAVRLLRGDHHLHELVGIRCIQLGRAQAFHGAGFVPGRGKEGRVPKVRGGLPFSSL